MAWALGLSEKEFFEKYDEYERAQLMATYESRQEREYVMSAFPPKRKA